MNQLIPVNYDSETPTVSGRALHEALKVATPYKDWFPRMCEYGFSEGKDFRSNLRKSTGGRPSTDHAVSISMAKELCMLQRTEMGKWFRQYFISIEEAWNSPERIMERALQIAHQRAIEAEARILSLAEENDTLEIALNQSLKYYTVAKYNKTFKMGWTLSQCQTIGKRLSAYCRSKAIAIRKCETNDERFGAVNSYPMTAWEDFFEENPL
jgi:phage anti-repressor protein